MGLSILAEALARIEHKVDLLLHSLKVPGHTYPKMQTLQFSNGQCPVCEAPIEYQIDVQHQVVVRRCDCKTGKVPSAIPLLPVVQPGAKNGYSPPDAEQPSDRTEKGPRGKAR